MQVNDKVIDYFANKPAELIELINSNKREFNLEHLSYYEHDEEFYHSYLCNNSSTDMARAVASSVKNNSFDYNDEYIKLDKDGNFKTLSRSEYVQLLLDNLDYIMKNVKLFDLSSKVQELMSKGHIMWCDECEDLIDSVSCIALTKTENTLSLDYDYDSPSLYDLDNENEIERYESTLYCENCGTKLNSAQCEFMMNLCRDNNIDIEINF